MKEAYFALFPMGAHVTGMTPYILSTYAYNATVFYLVNISFLENVLNQLFLPKENSISQASYRTMVLTICFQLSKKQTILWRWSGSKKKKCMEMY